MIRDACTTALALGALVWAGRLLWLGPPAPSVEEAPLRPWIDEGCSSVVYGVLDELAPKLAVPAPVAPTPSGVAAAMAALHEGAEGAPSREALALGRCLDVTARHEVEARWSRSTPASTALEAEFRAAAETAVEWWDELLTATDGSPLVPRACRWSVIGPLSLGARAEIVGRVRFAIESPQPVLGEVPR